MNGRRVRSPAAPRPLAKPSTHTFRRIEFKSKSWAATNSANESKHRGSESYGVHPTPSTGYDPISECKQPMQSKRQTNHRIFIFCLGRGPPGRGKSEDEDAMVPFPVRRGVRSTCPAGAPARPGPRRVQQRSRRMARLFDASGPSRCRAEMLRPPRPQAAPSAWV